VNARGQLEGLTRDLRATLGDSLVGVYAHGSFALGCFNPALSDLDVLAVTTGSPAPRERHDLEPLLGRVPRLEIHFLTESSLRHWRHPTPYELYFGSKQRLVGPGEDPDLAAHVTVARHAGVALLGAPATDVLPVVPWADYEESLWRDLEWCRAHGSDLYSVLSPARVWASLTERVVHSKASGAAWALARAPQEFRPLLSRALEAYRAGASEPRFEREEVRRLAAYVIEQLVAGENLAPSRDRL
jgi:predicted nucleotidyltransferase